MNYHSRNPFINMVATTGAAGPSPVALLNVINNTHYFVDYPEDIRLYGLSFQTNVSGTSLGGELSYRPNQPLQLSSPDFIGASLGRPTPLLITGFERFVPGEEMTSYKRMPVLQAQLTATHFIDQIWGASRLTLVGEVGYNRINGLGRTDGSDIRFGRNPIFGPGQLVPAGTSLCVGSNPGTPSASNPQQECNSHGFYTTHSWGYRARAKLDYANVFAGINLSPNLAWSHDVEGNGPNFEEGLKAVSIGVDADYLNTYTASLSYTDFFGGHFNTNGDRDFIALSFGVNF
ncbi:hypothetical protein D9M70_409890 [compost metagenome]